MPAALPSRECVWCGCCPGWWRLVCSSADSLFSQFWGASDEHDLIDGVSGFTLRFTDPQREHGFTISRKARLARSATNFSFATLIAYSLFSLTLLRVPGPSTDEGRWLMRLKVAFSTGAVLAFVFVLFVARSFALRGRIGSRTLEMIIVLSFTSLMLFLATFSLHYVGRMAGHDNTRAVFGLSEVVMASLDTNTLLLIDICVTAVHLAPIRWVTLLPLEVTAVLAYAVPAYAVGNTVPGARGLNTATLLGLTMLAAIGKRASERQERSLFAGMLTEKTQRFHAEFQLCRQQDGETIGAGTLSEGSRPDTTESGQAFQIARNGSLPAMRTIGEKEHWLIRESEVTPLSDCVLGQGSFGVVTCGLFQNTIVALKTPKQDVQVAERSLDNFCNELQILRRLRHPNIVFLYGACLDDSLTSLRLVLEFVRGVSLTNFIGRLAAISNGRQTDRISIMFDVVNALRYMHSRTPVVVHGDLKSSNVIVEEMAVGPSGTDTIDDGVSVCAKLLDFGLSRLLTRSAQPLGGTKRWRAPELFSHSKVRPDAATDVYSMGQLIYFIATGELPFHSRRMEDVIGLLQCGLVPVHDWPAWCDGTFLPKCCRTVVEWCSSPRPSARPTSEQVSTELSQVLEWDPARAARKRSSEDATEACRSKAAAAAAPPPHGAPPQAVPAGSRQDGPDPLLTAASAGCKRGGKRSSTSAISKAPDEALPQVPLERCGASVSVWFNVLSDKWCIRRATGCTEIFWGRGHQRRELGRFLPWIRPDVREDFIIWVQTTFQTLYSSAEPHWQTHEEAVLLCPPLLRSSSSWLSASVAMTLPSEQDRYMVQMSFEDIRLTDARPQT
ncbi:unnamed protein product [Prorocentrum cordatum]|uniref:Protein kinase domain-containing protein n=1 Tax=Prorocentrum cordatum TaxID=2364126 RepID=A0ABN9THI1_9DINO|nr:unnamed protein product [Polarella glacialis]